MDIIGSIWGNKVSRYHMGIKRVSGDTKKNYQTLFIYIIGLIVIPFLIVRYQPANTKIRRAKKINPHEKCRITTGQKVAGLCPWNHGPYFT